MKGELVEEYKEQYGGNLELDSQSYGGIRMKTASMICTERLYCSLPYRDTINGSVIDYRNGTTDCLSAMNWATSGKHVPADRHINRTQQ